MLGRPGGNQQVWGENSQLRGEGTRKCLVLAAPWTSTTEEHRGQSSSLAISPNKSGSRRHQATMPGTIIDPSTKQRAEPHTRTCIQPRTSMYSRASHLCIQSRTHPLNGLLFHLFKGSNSYHRKVISLIEISLLEKDGLIPLTPGTW